MKVLAAYIIILILECAMAMVASPLVIDNYLCKAENLKVWNSNIFKTRQKSVSVLHGCELAKHTSLDTPGQTTPS